MIPLIFSMVLLELIVIGVPSIAIDTDTCLALIVCFVGPETLVLAFFRLSDFFLSNDIIYRILTDNDDQGY
jgi:hypothetical protein